SFDSLEFAAQMFEVSAALLFVRQNEFGADAGYAVGQKFKALFERVAHGRRVQNDVTDLPPVVAFILPADDADRFLKRFAFDPKFAVQRRFGQSAAEPVGGAKFVAQPRDEALAVPVSADAVEFLAHPPPGEVNVVFPDMGQQQRRTLAFLSSFVSLFL